MQKTKKRKMIEFVTLLGLAYYMGKVFAEGATLTVGEKSIIERIIMLLIILSVIGIHELGHYIGGKMTGYRLIMVRFLIFQWTKVGSNLNFSIHGPKYLIEAIAGVSMLPEKNKKRIPFVLYTLGGVFLNLLTGILVYILAEQILGHSIFTETFIVVSIILILFNLIPHFGSDGEEMLLLYKKDPKRQRQQELEQGLRLLMEGVPYEEITDYFKVDRDKLLSEEHNIISILVKCEYLCSKEAFLEAKVLMAELYDEREKLSNKWLPDVYREYLFVCLMTGESHTIIEELYSNDFFQKHISQKQSAYNRVLAAYAIYVEEDYTKAQGFLEASKDSLRRELGPSDRKNEEQLISKLDKESQVLRNAGLK